MLKNYIKIAFRNLAKNKSFSIINILGFAFSISICLMILLFVMKEKSFDSYPNAEKIYRLNDAEKNTAAIDYRAGQIGLSNFSQIENACVVHANSGKTAITYDKNGYMINRTISTNNNFFKMFSVDFISGNVQNPLADSNSCVLSESAARKIFGKESPIGKEIVFWDDQLLYVAGIVKDFPDNSSFQADIFVNSEKFRPSSFCVNSDDLSSYRYYFNIYYQIKEKTDPVELTSLLNKRADVFAPYIKRMDFIPLRDTYLNNEIKGSFTPKGNPELINLMTNIALLTLILAVINYVNLTAAQQNKRNKETGIRKTVGASRKDMIYLFLSESVLVAFIAFGIAVALLEVFLPIFGSIIDKDLSSAALYEYPLIIIVSAAIFLTGIIAGIGPALIFSSFNPVRMFSGGFILRNKKSAFRNLLTVFQFSVSICLIFCLTVIQKQVNYVKHKDLGFDKEQTLSLKAPSDESKIRELRNKLQQNPDILSFSNTMGTPGEVFMSMGSGVSGKEEYLKCMFVDTAFLKTFSIQILKGRDFLSGDLGKACLFNEAAYKYFEWTDLENKRFNNGREGGYEVIGVVNNFNISSLHEDIAPTCLMLVDWTPSTFNLKIARGKAGAVMTFLEQTWKEVFPYYPMEYEFFDERFDAMYRKEEKFGELIGLFSLLAIVISCMGILGLAIFSAERRAKEIGIRKVHGASVPELMLMLNSDFIKWVIIAFVIAAPLGYYLMNKWLEDFAFKTAIDWSVFLLSGSFALIIAILTVNWQIWRTTTRNPVEVLKYE